MRTTLMAMTLLTMFAATAAAQPPSTAAQAPPTRIATNDGSVLHGSIGGGLVTVRTTFGSDVRVDGRRIVGFSGTTVTLDDGSTLQGTLTAGALQFFSPFGTVAIPVDRVTEIQIPKPGGTAAAPPATKPATPATVAATPPARAATKATVQLVNETRRNLSVCLNEERPCLQMAPNGSTTKTVDIGPLRLRVESTTQLGILVVGTGNFDKTVSVDKDTTVRLTENDFR